MCAAWHLVVRLIHALEVVGAVRPFGRKLGVLQHIFYRHLGLHVAHEAARPHRARFQDNVRTRETSRKTWRGSPPDVTGLATLGGSHGQPELGGSAHKTARSHLSRASVTRGREAGCSALNALRAPRCSPGPAERSAHQCGTPGNEPEEAAADASA